MTKLQVSTEVPTEIHMTRVFDAPRHLVLEAMTTPELIKRWLGGKRAVVTSTEHDLRPGGRYRNAFRTHEGFEFAFVGTYHEVSDDRIVFEEQFEGQPGASQITTTFTEVAGKTTMTMVMKFPTQELRDMVLQTGMTEGAGESYDELEKLLHQL
jgi:uncharacterized protein YndB with AHSA1/START domain